mgnify:CR=1 FL=1
MRSSMCPNCEAHPRACGENVTSITSVAIPTGSSPRVRGKPPPPPGRASRRRLIPARAGKTPCRTSTRTIPWAHPRACGENAPKGGTYFPPSGSSPRVRGKRLRALEARATARLIPARAGKTLDPQTDRFRPSAHPRACGENNRVLQATGQTEGSSPRVRGKPRRTERGSALVRLIPARAGKTARGEGHGRRRWAHPRACGENLTPAGRYVIQGGSSPRVRGKQPPQGRPFRRSRLIPARAGKTAAWDPQRSSTWAHPRACGENARW